MKDVSCPKCYHEFDVSSAPKWSVAGFEAECPACKAELWIDVEVESVLYFADIRDDI